MIDRELPANRELEQNLLGSVLLLDSDQAREALAEIATDRFHFPAHRAIAEALRRLHAKGAAVDLVTLRDELRHSEELEQVGGMPYLIAVAESVVNASNIATYADLVKGYAHRRDAIEYARGLERMAFGTSDLSKLDFMIACGPERSGWQVPTLEPWGEADLDAEGHRGIAVGLSLLDGEVPAVLIGEMTVVMARRGFGKTTLLADIALQAKRSGFPSLYVSFGDMTRGQMLRKWFRMTHGYAYNRYDMLHREKAARLLPDLPDCLDRQPDPLIEPVRRFVERNRGYKLVVLDYVQLIKTEAQCANGWERQRAISEQIRRMARDCDCAVVVGSQVTVGEGGAEGARNGQELENDAAAVIRVGPAHTTKGEQPTPDDGLKLELVKHRHGRTGRRSAGIEPNYVRIEETSE